MRIRNNPNHNASPYTDTSDTRRNGRACPRCKRFGTFAPNSIVCDRCMGALPLIFTVTITIVVVGGDHR
jgi:hypothetical protein